MSGNPHISYEDSGVSTKKGAELVSNISTIAKATHTSNVLNPLGSFAAMFDLSTLLQQESTKFQNPVLVSGTDGVGTKLLVAIEHNDFESIGQDCVAMCVNDILCHGATPLFFLDYLACGTLDSSVATRIITGIAKACQNCNCALVGGESAEMPGMYKKGDYDVAGFALGIVGKPYIIDGSEITEGDVIIGCASNGLHSNGFSLVRALFKDRNISANDKPLYQRLLTPTRLYVNSILQVLDEFNYTANSPQASATAHKIIKGLAHITGGGIIENLPRIIPKGLIALVDRTQIPTQDIFQLIRSTGKVKETELWNTFNMGIGMVLVVAKEQAHAVQQSLNKLGEQTYIIGSMQSSEKSLTYHSLVAEEKICLI